MEEKFYSKFTEKRTPKTNKKDKKQKYITEENKRNEEKRFDNRKKYDDRRVAGGKYQSKTPVTTDATYSLISSQFSTSAIPSDAQWILDNFDQVVQGVRPLNSRQLQQLPDNIRTLSHQLTDERATRRLGYMNESVQLSSYVRYYVWWNLVRLTRLFANLPAQAFPQNDCVCLDLGSGPLTVVTALWLARPELRKKNLTWYCLDVSSSALSLGEDIYLSVAARMIGTVGNESNAAVNGRDLLTNQNDTDTSESLSPWKIIRVKDSFGAFIKQKCGFITCANMFNELDQASDMPPEFQTKKYFDQLKNYAEPDAKFLLVEPGVPKAARTLSLLRNRFIKAGAKVMAPCPHAEECPMNGFKSYTGSKNKWCNFAFSTESAPEKLKKLSDAAKLPKERATLSYLTVDFSEHNDKEDTSLVLRLASDRFNLPVGRCGFYACSKLGLTLISLEAEEAEKLNSGDLISVKIKTPNLSALVRDEKSGAILIRV